jgi:8-oxo-dGTP pyrophosphatase MutT (NUDIX family)
MAVQERAVCVCLDGDRILVMRRRKAGRHYTVLPGGGVEPGETPRETAVRELAEETGLVGVVEEELVVIDHDDRRAHSFLVRVGSASGPVLGGPEAEAQSVTDVHTPTWISVSDLPGEPIVPEQARAVVVDACRRMASGDQVGCGVDERPGRAAPDGCAVDSEEPDRPASLPRAGST